MNGPAGARLRGVAAGVALLSPVVSHVAIAMGQGYGAAVAMAALQAAATGLLIWDRLPTRRWLGALVWLALWAALAVGERQGTAAALLAEAGVAHALLYTGLLVVFARSLRPGRVALVTWVASRVNPRFHIGQIPYTRAVTWAWVGVFAAELAASAILLATASGWWAGFVTTWHVALPIGVAVVEVAIRRWRWRQEDPTGLLDTIRGTRRLMRQAASASTTRQ